MKTVNRHLLFHTTNIFLFTYKVNLNLEEFPITPSPFLSADKKTNEIYFKNGNYRYLQHPLPFWFFFLSRFHMCCHPPPLLLKLSKTVLRAYVKLNITWYSTIYKREYHTFYYSNLCYIYMNWPTLWIFFMAVLLYQGDHSLKDPWASCIFLT